VNQSKGSVRFFLLGTLASLLVFATVLTPRAIADELYGSIRGSVSDASGAMVPDAKITATNMATGITRTATTGKDGT
jgi:hypothetical protein